MGLDCHNYIPHGTRAKDVEEFLFLLGYRRSKKGPFCGMVGTPYSYYDESDYRYTTGIYAEIYQDDEHDNQLILWTRTTVWRSKYDSDFHNLTIKQVKKRFGGHFISDYGKNRYFKFDGPTREKAEAGVYKAFLNFSSNIQRAESFFSYTNLADDDQYKISGIDFMDSVNPRILSTNILIPFIVSAIEDFFRSSYIALLRYSPRRERIIQNSRIQNLDFVAINRKESTVVESVAKWLSFQDIKKIDSHFKELNPKYDISGVLKRPYGRRRETPWDTLERITQQRHALIHKAEICCDYKPEHLKRDIKTVLQSIIKVYDKITTINEWTELEKWRY